jgi:hypothetical protein
MLDLQGFGECLLSPTLHRMVVRVIAQTMEVSPPRIADIPDVAFHRIKLLVKSDALEAGNRNGIEILRICWW